MKDIYFSLPINIYIYLYICIAIEHINNVNINNDIYLFSKKMYFQDSSSFLIYSMKKKKKL